MVIIVIIFCENRVLLRDERKPYLPNAHPEIFIFVAG